MGVSGLEHYRPHDRLNEAAAAVVAAGNASRASPPLVQVGMPLGGACQVMQAKFSCNKLLSEICSICPFQ